MIVARNRTRALAQLSSAQLSSSPEAAGRKQESCYVETGTNSNLFYLKYIPKVLQDPLKGKESRYQNNNYNRLLCFRLDKVSHDY